MEFAQDCETFTPTNEGETSKRKKSKKSRKIKQLKEVIAQQGGFGKSNHGKIKNFV